MSAAPRRGAPAMDPGAPRMSVVIASSPPRSRASTLLAAFGAYRLHRARSRRGAPRFVPDLGYYAKVFRRPVAAGRPGVAIGALALLCVWQLANVAGFLWEGAVGDHRRKSPRA